MDPREERDALRRNTYSVLDAAIVAIGVGDVDQLVAVGNSRSARLEYGVEDLIVELEALRVVAVQLFLDGVQGGLCL